MSLSNFAGWRGNRDFAPFVIPDSLKWGASWAYAGASF